MNDTTAAISAGPPPLPSPPVPSSPSAAGLVQKGPRLWPGLVIVVLQWCLMKIPPQLAPGTMYHIFGLMGGIAIGVLGFLVWWTVFSRVPMKDRWICLAGCAAAGATAFVLSDDSFKLQMVFMFALPIVFTGWVLWLTLTWFLSWPVRRAGLMVVVALIWGSFACIRVEGVIGRFEFVTRFRWDYINDEAYLAQNEIWQTEGQTIIAPAPAKPLTLQPGDWPCFRGPQRNSRLPGLRIDAYWDERPPKLLWKKAIGGGYSSFAVIGTHLYTQEQRGEFEVVVCRHTDTGKDIWIHKDELRFIDKTNMSSPGPRATPTFHEGKLYTLGATGLLNCFDAATGKRLWSKDIKVDSGAEVPIWGFSSSPYVSDNVVTVFAGGKQNKNLLGYDAADGKLLWTAKAGPDGYCSPQPARLGGVDQLVISSNFGLTGFLPKKGEVLWQFDWNFDDKTRVAQPAIVDDSTVLIGSGFGLGIQKVTVTHQGNTWEAKPAWKKPSKAINPYYNDFVIHRDHIYGFDNFIFTCVSVKDGKSKWRARGYGNGQVLLLPDQDLMVILTEKGEVALVAASSSEHQELHRFQAIVDRTTWNHPVIAHGKLFVRNGHEAACYQLGVESGTAGN